MSSRFEGKVAIVTGAANGIGAAIAQRFLAEGASVVAVDLTDAAHVLGKGAASLVASVADVDTAQQALTLAMDRFGRLDILVNNVGVSKYAALEDFDDALFAQHLSVNVAANFRMCRTAVPAMRQGGYGRIISIASVSALRAVKNHMGYTASKAAVLGLTRALAVELGPDAITVNAILPGPVMTEMMRNTISTQPEKEEYLGNLGVFGRMATPEEIAAPVAFLASEEANFITGQAIAVDGGVTAKL